MFTWSTCSTLDTRVLSVKLLLVAGSDDKSHECLTTLFKSNDQSCYRVDFRLHCSSNQATTFWQGEHQYNRFPHVTQVVDIIESSCHLDFPINVWDGDFNYDPDLYTHPAFSKEEYEAVPPLPLLSESPTSLLQVQLVANSLLVSLTIVFPTLSQTIVFLHHRTSRLNWIIQHPMKTFCTMETVICTQKKTSLLKMTV